MHLILCLLSVVLWSEDFNGQGTMQQLYDYTVSIHNHDGYAMLRASPRYEGGASAWFRCDEGIRFSQNDVLTVALAVNKNAARLKYFYYDEQRKVYCGGKEIVYATNNVQTVEIPFMHAKPFYSSDFPYALTPGTIPSLFLFVDNLLPGDYEVIIDRITVNRRSEEEQ